MAVALVFYCDSAVDRVINPLVIKNAEEAINNEVNSAVEELLESNKINCDNLVNITKNGNNITALTLNNSYVNYFKTLAVKNAQNKLDNHKNMVTYVQLGSLFPSAFLSNRGPDIPILFDFYCSVNANIKSNISDAGINQTLHIVTLNITTKFSIVLLNGEYNSDISNDYVVCETLINGTTPNYYGSLYGGVIKE